MVTKSNFKFNGLSWFLGGVSINLLFNSDTVNLKLKPKWGGKSLIFLFL